MSRPGPRESVPSIASSIVGLEVGPRRAEIDARWLMAYAAAVGPHRPPCFDTTAADGPLAHPLFPVCYEWPVLLAIRAHAIGEAAAPFGVHLSHRLLLHRLPRAGDELTSMARVTAVAARRSGTLVVARLVTRDAAGNLVSETDYGSLYRGVPVAGNDSPDRGVPLPDNDFPDRGVPVADGDSPHPGVSVADGAGHASAARGSLPGSSRYRADAPDPIPRGPAMAPPRWTHAVEVPYHFGHVYTECARIWNPIHTDLAVARAADLPWPILHGTATLALAVSSIVERDLDGDCRAVRGIEARFTGMVALPSTLTVQAGVRSLRDIAFQAVDGHDARVLGEGVLRL